MHHILVAVDGSDLSQAAAHYALDFARAGKLEMEALGVLLPEVMASLGETPETLAYSSQIPEGEQMGKRAIRDWFDRTEGLCEEAGVCFARRMDAGVPGERLAWAAMSAHLCAFGAHGSHAALPHPAGQGLGRTAYHLVRNSLKPMLIARGEYRPIKRVVLAWDGHPQAAHAAEILATFGRGEGWEVLVVAGALPTTPTAQSCSGIAEALNQAGLTAEPVVAEGNFPQVAFDAIQSYHPDLIALGGYHHARGLLTEGPWLQVVEQVQIPVLLYR